MRDKFVTKSNQIWARAHTIFTINLVQKDKENENIPFMNSTIQFVDLAGSERIAKTLTEGHKFEETILINTSLTALGKCLQCIALGNKQIPYKESQMTRVLQNCMGIGSYVSLIINLHPGEPNYDECISSLQFAERTKISQPKLAQPQLGTNISGPSTSGNQQEDFVMQSLGGFAGNDKLIKSLKDQIKDLETKIDFISRENKQKMLEVQNILGLEIDLDKILSRSSLKDMQQFKLQREAVPKLENIQNQNKNLEEDIKQLHLNIEEIQREEALKQERQTALVNDLKDKVKKLKEQINSSKQKGEEELRKLNQDREQDMKAIIEKSNLQLEEKTNVILHLNNTLQNKTQENQRVNELRRNTKLEVEKEQKNQLEGVKGDYSKMVDQSKSQFDQLLKNKNDEINKYVHSASKYKQKKKQPAIYLSLMNLLPLLSKGKKQES